MNKQQLAAKIWESTNQMRSMIEANGAVLTLAEVAAYLKVTERTIYRLAGAKKIPVADYGLPSSHDAVELPFGHDSYGWPGAKQASAGNPYKVQGNDHGGLTPEETVIPVAVYITRGAK